MGGPWSPKHAGVTSSPAMAAAGCRPRGARAGRGGCRGAKPGGLPVSGRLAVTQLDADCQRAGLRIAQEAAIRSLASRSPGPCSGLEVGAPTVNSRAVAPGTPNRWTLAYGMRTLRTRIVGG